MARAWHVVGPPSWSLSFLRLMAGPGATDHGPEAPNNMASSGKETLGQSRQHPQRAVGIWLGRHQPSRPRGEAALQEPPRVQGAPHEEMEDGVCSQVCLTPRCAVRETQTGAAYWPLEGTRRAASRERLGKGRLLRLWTLQERSSPTSLRDLMQQRRGTRNRVRTHHACAVAMAVLRSV